MLRGCSTLNISSVLVFFFAKSDKTFYLSHTFMLFLILSARTFDQGRISISRVWSYLSGALALQLQTKWWEGTKTWTSFFYMCVTESPTRNKCVFLRGRNCRTVWNEDKKKTKKTTKKPFFFPRLISGASLRRREVAPRMTVEWRHGLKID